jgi:hypothetical protein
MQARGRASDAAGSSPRADVGELRRASFLAGLSDQERESLLGVGLLRSYPRGAALMLQDEPDDRVMIVLAGRAKIARVEQDGRELMLDIRDPGDLLDRARPRHTPHSKRRPRVHHADPLWGREHLWRGAHFRSRELTARAKAIYISTGSTTGPERASGSGRWDAGPAERGRLSSRMRDREGARQG